jgi:hypothetical protein
MSEYFEITNVRADISRRDHDRFFETTLRDQNGKEYTTYISPSNRNWDNWKSILPSYDEVILTNIKTKKNKKGDILVNADSKPTEVWRGTDQLEKQKYLDKLGGDDDPWDDIFDGPKFPRF